jgi:hypothetical protein
MNVDHIEWLELHSTGLGKKIRYRLDINAEEFRGRAGVTWLIMAANPQLSIDELCAVMEEAFGCYRPRSWVWRRRWIFLDPANVRKAGGVSDADGQQARAYRIMDQHRAVSARELVRILRKSGIKRGRDWVLKHRVH